MEKEEPLIEVTTSQREGMPMLNWCIEQTSELATALGSLSEEILRRNPDLQRDDELLTDLNAAARRTLKLLSLFTGNLDGQQPDPTTISLGGNEGVSQLLARWRQRPAAQAETKRLQEFVSEARELLREGRPARTRLYMLLRNYPKDARRLAPLADVLEELTNNDIGWEEFHRMFTQKLDLLDQGARWYALSDGDGHGDKYAHILDANHPPDTLCGVFGTTGMVPRPSSFWHAAPEAPRCRACSDNWSRNL